MADRMSDRTGNVDLDSISGFGAKRCRIFSAEEWSRIHDHLERINKAEIKKETSFQNESEGEKKLSKSLAGVYSSFKTDDKSVKGALKEKCHDCQLVKSGHVDPKRKQRKMEMNRENIIKRAKAMLFENKDYARQLLSGLRLSTVLHERNKQIEFDCHLRNLKQVNRREMVAKSKKEAEIIMEELKARRLCEKKKKEKLRRDLDRQIMEKAEEKNVRELEIGREKAHLKKLEEELQMLEEKKRLEKENKKMKFKAEIEAYLKSEKELRRKFELEQKVADEINDINKIVALEIEKKRREKEKRFVRTPEKAITKTGETQVKRAERNEDSLKNYLMAREERRRMLLNDFLASRREEKEKLEKRDKAEKLERERSRAERCKKEEADRAWERKEKEKAVKRKRKVMLDYMRQWQEKAEERKIENSRGFPAADYSEENAAISEYCSEMLRLAERHQRPLYPVVAAIKDIKREFGMERKKNLSFLQSKVAIGDSRCH